MPPGTKATSSASKMSSWPTRKTYSPRHYAFTRLATVRKPSPFIGKSFCDPADCRVLNRLGILLYQSARPDQAVACFQEAIRVNAHDFQAYANLGKVLQDDGQLGPAIDCYRQALRWQPEQLGVLVNLGSALNKQGQVIEAEACYHHVLRINPAHADALYNLGNLLFQQKRFTDAAACYQEILRFNLTTAIAQHALGNVFFEEDRLEAAIQCYHLVLQINPGQLHARMNLANACYFLGEPAQAEYHYRLVLEVMPDDPDVLVNLGNALRNQNLLAAAAQCFATALTPVRTMRRQCGAAASYACCKVISRAVGQITNGAGANRAARHLRNRAWDGQPLGGRTILVARGRRPGRHPPVHPLFAVGPKPWGPGTLRMSASPVQSARGHSRRG